MELLPHCRQRLRRPPTGLHGHWRSSDPRATPGSVDCGPLQRHPKPRLRGAPMERRLGLPEPRGAGERGLERAGQWVPQTPVCLERLLAVERTHKPCHQLLHQHRQGLRLALRRHQQPPRQRDVRGHRGCGALGQNVPELGLPMGFQCQQLPAGHVRSGPNRLRRRRAGVDRHAT